MLLKPRSRAAEANSRKIPSIRMLVVTHQSNPARPPDICLLLRAHAEHRWLSHEVLPVLRQLERRDSLPEEQLGAALAYLEVLWIEASQRATETDAAYAELEGVATNGDRALHTQARSYHAAVQDLRGAIAGHVAKVLAAPTIAPEASPRWPISDRYASS
jgi:hypothetical protein